MRFVKQLFRYPGTIDRNSLPVRLTLGVLCILGISFFAFGFLTIQMKQREMRQQAEEYGQSTADFVAQISRVPLQKYSYYQLENYVEQLEKGHSMAFCRIYDADNVLLTQSTHPRGEAVNEDGKSDNLLVFIAPIRDADTVYGRVELGVDFTGLQAHIEKQGAYFSSFLLLVLIFAGAAINYYIHYRFIKPIFELSALTRRIADGHFIRASAQAHRHDEIGIFANSILTMSRKLDESYANLERKIEQRTAEVVSARDEAIKAGARSQRIARELEAILNNSPFGIIFFDSHYKIHKINSEFSHLTGFDEEDIIGKDPVLFFRERGLYDTIAARLNSQLFANGTCETVFDFNCKDGSQLTCSVRGRLIAQGDGYSGVIFSVEDISERVQMEQELLRIKKLESLGVLADGIAHDFNNILMALIGNLSLLQKMAETVGENKYLGLLEESRNAALRARELTEKLLLFAKGGDSANTVVAVGTLLKNSVRTILGESSISVTYTLEEPLWAVKMNGEHVEQLVQSLVENAERAMEGCGTLFISAKNSSLSADELAGIGAGDYVQLRIKDSGVGIMPEILEKIFDPYFSTGERGSVKGSGLGLSIVRSVLVKNGGAIFAESEVGNGAEFIIYLPAISDENILEGTNIVPTGKGMVLLIDSDRDVFVLAEEMLLLLGYGAIYADSDDNALLLLKKQQQAAMPVSYVLMEVDNIQSCKDSLERLVPYRTGFPLTCIVASVDDAASPLLSAHQEYGFDNIVMKPFELLELSRVMSESLQL